MPKTVRRNFENFKGINKSFSALTKPQEFAEEAQNCFITENFDLEQRPGGKFISFGDAGLAKYVYTDSSGAIVREIVLGTEYKLSDETITFAYSGGGTGRISLLPTGSAWRLTVTEDGVDVSGFPKTYTSIVDYPASDLSTLVSDVDGLSNWTCSASDTTNIYACYLPIIELQEVGSGGVSFNYVSLANLEPGGLGTGEAFDRTSYSSLNDVLFAARGSSEVVKYDGFRVYRSGVPELTQSVLAIANGGSGSAFTANTTYSYLFRYVRIDARGNRIEGPLSEVVSHTVGGTAQDSLNITYPVWNDSSSDTRASYFSSATTSGNVLNINGTYNALQWQVGGEVYFWDEISAAWVVRNITAVSSSPWQITVDGDAVTTVATGNKATISNNIRLEVYRTKGNANSPFYLVDEPANASVGSTVSTTYTDDTAEASLSVNLIEPDVTRGRPPAGSYLCSHQGLLFVTGNSTTPNRVYFNDVTGSEYFDPDLGFLDLPFTTTGVITGIVSDGQNLIVFKPRERAIVRGDFITNSFFVEVVSDGVGCSSHHSICRGVLGIYFMSLQGPQRLINSELDFGFNNKMSQFFRSSIADSDVGYSLVADSANYVIDSSQVDKLVVDLATSFYDERRSHVYMFAPALTSRDGFAVTTVSGPNENSWFYVYDEKQDAWTEYIPSASQYPISGGVVSGSDLYISTTLVTEAVSDEYIYTLALFKEHVRDDSYVAADDYAAIEFCYESAWDSLDNPSVYKKWLRLRTWSMRLLNRIASSLAITVTKNFSDSDTLSSFTHDFTGATTLEDRSKISSQKATAIKVKFYNNTLHEAPRITGYEMEVSMPYEGGELEKP